LLLCHAHPWLQNVDMKRAMVKSIAKSALDTLTVELASTAPTDLNVDACVARVIELTLACVARDLEADTTNR